MRRRKWAILDWGVRIPKRQWRRMCAQFRRDSIKLHVRPGYDEHGQRIVAIGRMIVTARRFRRDRG